MPEPSAAQRTISYAIICVFCVLLGLFVEHFHHFLDRIAPRRIQGDAACYDECLTWREAAETCRNELEGKK